MPDARTREIAERIVANRFRVEYYDKYAGYYDACSVCEQRWDGHRLECDAPKLIDAIAAALTRERDAENEACARAVCPGCEKGWRVERQLYGDREMYHVVPAGIREDEGRSWTHCDADEIRQRRTPGAAEGERTDG